MDLLLQVCRTMAAALDTLFEVGDDTGARKAPPPPPGSSSRKVRRAAKRSAAAKKKKKVTKARAAGDRRIGWVVGPWLALLVVLAGGGFGGYYLFGSMQAKDKELAAVKGELSTMMGQVADAEDRAMSAHADLGKTEAELDGLKKRMEEKAAAADELANKLEALVGKDGALKRGKDGRLTLELMDKVLFKLGDDQLTERGVGVLTKVGDALQSVPDKQVWVQGHTDDVPIGKDNPRFTSNWELSSARALNVVQFLQYEMKVDPRRLASVAFSEYRPVSRRKARNRRIEIVLVPKDVEIIRN